MLSHVQEKPIRRGDRRWLSAALDNIEKSGGIETRALAAQRWADLVWDTPANTIDGADAVEDIKKLSDIAAKLIDYSAQNVIKNVMRINNKKEVERIINLFETTLAVDLINQSMTEKTIAKIAAREPSELSATRRLRMIRSQAIYSINFRLKLIGDRVGEYRLCTPFQQADRNLQKAGWRAFGESVEMVCDDKKVHLIDIMNGAATRRRAELYALMTGMDSYATAAGMTWAMVTLTCPPRMHPNPANGNCSWDKTNPRQANNFLLHHWQKAEKYLRKKYGIIIAGYRPMEGMSDGTPHWHVMVFASPEDMQIIEKVLRKQVPEWHREPGLHFRLNDGSAKSYSYASKYVFKTIGSIDNMDGEAGGNDVLRSAYGIRSFQWFGMPPVGLWRALYKMKEEPECEELRGIWRAVHRGDGHAYIGLAGGLNVKKKDRPFQLKIDGTIEYKRTEFTIKETGEVVTMVSKKWKWTRAAKKAPATGTVAKTAATPNPAIDMTSEKINKRINVVGVIPNYPRKPNTPQPTPEIDFEIDLEAELEGVLGLDFRSQHPPPCPQPQNFQTLH